MPKTSTARAADRAAARRGTAVGTQRDTSNEQRVTSNGGQRPSGLVRPGNRPSSVVAFDDDVVSFFVDAADMLGVPKSVAAIYGICFASAEPLSFSEIDERLEISSGSISQGIRVLKEVGALKLAGPSGGVVAPSSEYRATNNAARNAQRFEPDLELRKLVLHWIEKRLQGQLASGRSRLKQIMAGIPPVSSGEAETLHARFESLQAWQDKAHSLLPIAKTFLKLT